MNGLGNDPIWPHFQPLWTKLSGVAGSELAIAGGYGLFLKQNWLTANPDVPVVVPITEWRDVVPRVTKDVDLVIGLDLIANEEMQVTILQEMIDSGFPVTKDLDAQHWRFEKHLPENKTIIIELLAPVPDDHNAQLTFDRKRVKLKSSPGDTGFDARKNPAAVGFERHPFHFELDGTRLAVVNPVTWSTMKLSAMRSQREQSLKPEIPAEKRTLYQAQAAKHANDVCRIVAMITREERDAAEEVVAALAAESVFEEASNIYRDDFATTGWGLQSVTTNWNADGLQVIQSILDTWYRR